MKKLFQIICSLFIAYTMTACVGTPVQTDSSDRAAIKLMDDLNQKP